MKMNRRRFVLLDRDGTIIVERNYLSDQRLVELIDGAAKGLSMMREMGLGLAVVTNQSGIGRGYFTLEQLHLIHERMRNLLAGEGVSIDGIFFCPHTPDDGCPCRKPQPELVVQAATALDFEPSQCFVIGDKPCDIELGQNVGAQTILVRTGYGVQIEAEQSTNPDHVVDDLTQAAIIIRKILLTSDVGARLE